jgi:hypothetical protein
MEAHFKTLGLKFGYHILRCFRLSDRVIEHLVPNPLDTSANENDPPTWLKNLGGVGETLLYLIKVDVFGITPRGGNDEIHLFIYLYP